MKKTMSTCKLNGTFYCHRIPKEDVDELVHYEHTENEVCVDALITPQKGLSLIACGVIKREIPS